MITQRNANKVAACGFAAILVYAVLAQGCATTKVSTHDFCSVAKPILVGKDDKLSDTTAKELLAHNLTGRKLCSW